MQRRRTPYYLLLHMLLLTATGVAAQDLHFSQFFEAPLLRNPSLAGIFTGDVRAQAVYRSQWNSVTTAYRTTSINGEYRMPVGKNNDFITTGVQMLHDAAGTVGWRTTHLLPALNYHKSLSRARVSYLSAGFMGGPVQQRLDITKITTNTTYDNGGTGENIPSASLMYFDAAAGLSYNAQIGNSKEQAFFLGVAYHHFNRPKSSFYRNTDIELQPKMVASAGLKLLVGDNSFVTVQADHSRQGQFSQTIGGALFGYKLGPDPDAPDYVIHAGTFLRLNDALIPVIKLDYFPMSLTFSYDANISTLRPSTFGRGGFELGISYTAFVRRKSSAENAVICPRF